MFSLKRTSQKIFLIPKFVIGGFHVTQISLIITQVKNKIVYHSIYWVKKLKYRRRVINKQRAKVSGMCDIPNSSYSAKVSLKFIGFSMETPCWSPSEGLQHGDRKPVETSGVHFGSLKTFILSVKLENIRIGTSLNILVVQNSKT